MGKPIVHFYSTSLVHECQQVYLPDNYAGHIIFLILLSLKYLFSVAGYKQELDRFLFVLLGVLVLTGWGQLCLFFLAFQKIQVWFSLGGFLKLFFSSIMLFYFVCTYFSGCFHMLVSLLLHAFQGVTHSLKSVCVEVRGGKKDFLYSLKPEMVRPANPLSGI